jgi:hypothetical protein
MILVADDDELMRSTVVPVLCNAGYCAGAGGIDEAEVCNETQRNAFGQTLMPILQQVGLAPGQPAIAEVHHIIAG